uniref:Uncharacterized protein n=1 Tax=Rhizophora mucronata TaxID=61149 RepID=A0A2P2NPR1_RHIMU
MDLFGVSFATNDAAHSFFQIFLFFFFVAIHDCL